MNGNAKTMVCPLLKNPELYNPDTVDLINNVNERTYWLECLDQMVKKFIGKAGDLNPENPCATQNAEICFNKFHELVEGLGSNPSLLEPLSVRTLLEINEDNLRANSFKDAWFSQKEKESEAALLEFSNRISTIDSNKNFEEKWLDLAKGVLAGNIFDWGSRAVSDILEHSNDFGFNDALDTIQKRPWFHDDLDLWIDKLKVGPYKTAVIFVDNAGMDFILGILPLARELLRQKTKVILTANTLPALNDVTYQDLNRYVCKAAEKCAVLTEAIKNGRLVTIPNGQKGPCLDMMHLSPDLCKLMADADLIMIEGMGRAIHTNLYAKFNVDSVKLAVLKNEWLAKSLGAQQFSIIFKYEPLAL